MNKKEYISPKSKLIIIDSNVLQDGGDGGIGVATSDGQNHSDGTVKRNGGWEPDDEFDDYNGGW